MRRKITEKLIDWKENWSRKVALLIDGARRVGKSYIVEQFAIENYKSYIKIDFDQINDDIKDLFNYYISDLDKFFFYLENFYGIKLYEHESLIIFDEVQMFPKARAAIKYLVKDGRYDYIETGSLISINENVEDILIPSEERHVLIYPMDFEEFLWALNYDTLPNFIKTQFYNCSSLGQSMHRKTMDLLRLYMIVGGMPQAVLEYIETNDFERVDLIKRDILNLYREDISKHAKKYRYKVESIFDLIPAQLQRHDKKFKLSSIKKKAKQRDYEDAWMWLEDAMIVNNCYNSTNPNIGLKMNKTRTTLKCYMNDTGLLISHAFDENTILSNQLYKKILFDKLELNEGMIMENLIAQMLVASNHKLFYYTNASKKDKDNRMEIDFLISKENITSKHNISAIEVKTGKRYTTNSLNKFINKYESQLYKPYIIHDGEFKISNGITYLPIYMTPFI